MVMQFWLSLTGKLVYNRAIDARGGWHLAIWGIMGGSFDPIHTGHLFMADQAMEHVRLDGVLFIPAGDPPHKSRLAPAEHRLRMVELSIIGRTTSRISDMEIRREQRTYTFDTLCQLRNENPGDEYVYIVGTDTLLSIESWWRFPEVPPLLRGVACVPRPEISRSEALRMAEHLRKTYGLEVFMLDEMGPSISSTDVRNRAERHQSIKDMVPAKVADYIAEHRLYQSPLFEMLRTDLTPDRFKHTLGVERAALKLAAKNGVDPQKARLAALLHDCAKCMDERDMGNLLRRHGMEPKFVADRTRTLMHAAAGMILAKEKYGIHDPEILGAIRWHTTGRAGMTKLEKLIYLADVVEPNRRVFPALPAIRGRR